MNKILHSINIIFVIYTYSSFGQPANLVWKNSFGGYDDELGRDIEKTADGGFLSVGYTRTFGNGDWDILLLKTDYYGEMQWYKSYGGIEDDCGYSIQKTVDAGFIVAGYNGSVHSISHSWILRIDSNGDTLWTKIYNFYQHSVASSIIQTNDGGFVLTGSANQSGIGTHVFLIKTNANGDTSWSNTYKLTNTTSSGGFSVKETDDNGYIVTGRSGNASGEDIFLLKTNTHGDSLWSYVYNIYDHDHSSDVIQTYDGGYILTGYALSLASGISKVLNLKTDNLGNILWTSLLDLPGGSSGSGIIQIADSSFVIMGTSGGKLLTAGLGQYGDSLWTNLMGDSAFQVGSSIRMIESGEYIFSGSTREVNTNHLDMLFGRLSTNPIIADFSADTLSGTIPLIVSFQDNSSYNVKNWSWDFKNDGIIDSELQNPTWTVTESDTYSVKLIVSNESMADTIVKENYIVTYLDSFPNLYKINDVPNDQGGWVTVHFSKSLYDTDTLIHPKYKTELYTVEANYDSMWTAVNSTAAYGKSHYSVLVPTIKDSTAFSNGLIDFRIIAGMDEGNFVSNVLSGYSVDNLEPSAPQSLSGFLIQDTIALLQWFSNKEQDFQYYSVFRSTDGINFVSIYDLTDTTHIDTFNITVDSVFYGIKAVDYSGNHSTYSNFINFIVNNIPNDNDYTLDFRLHQNYPNPFNPETKIIFDLPESKKVKIEVFNVLGQKIKTILNKQISAGTHQVGFDARGLPSGVYLYRINAGEYQQVKKMVLLR